MACSIAEATTSDEDLACRAQRGCAASFEQLLRRFQTPVLQFLRRRGLSDDAEDIAQETFLRAYSNLHRYRRRWAFSTWLFTIARRVSINHCRRARPIADAAVVATAAAQSPEPLDVMVADEGSRRLWELADRVLSEDQRTALWLRYVEDKPLRDTAQVLGCSLSAAKTILFRARRKLMPYFLEMEEEAVSSVVEELPHV